MITLVAAFGILYGNSQVKTPQTTKAPSIQLQEKTYPLTKPLELISENVVLDGHGATLVGSNASVGIHIGPFSHVVVKNVKLVGFATGILAQGATDLTLINVSVQKCGDALRLEKSNGALLQGVQAHNCKTGANFIGCSKLIVEKSDLSQNEQFGIALSGSSRCIVRENKIAGIGEGTTGGSDNGIGIAISGGSDHNQILRNVAAHCRTSGIRLSSVGNQPSTDNTIQGNELSWSVRGVGLLVESEASNQILDNTAGYCQIGFQFSKVSGSTIKGNLAVGNTICGIKDEFGSNNTYDTNVFVEENGGTTAMWFRGTEGTPSAIRLFQNVFMGYQKPLRIENTNPLTLQSNQFPWMKSTALSAIADIVGKSPISLDSTNEKPGTDDFVPSIGAIAQIPSMFDRLGGISVSSTHLGEMEVVVEGSLTGAFRGEEEVLARYKGQLPVDITFPPRFVMFVRVRQVAEKPSFIAFLALLGDNSMARNKPADDSGDTLFKPSLAVDGDIVTTDNAWIPPTGKAGDWWEVDLKLDQTLTAFSVLANPASPDDFWKKFHIAVSSTGLFKGEETTVVTETDWTKRPGPLRVYRIPSVTGRYVRVYGDIDQQGVQLKQFGVYGIKQ